MSTIFDVDKVKYECSCKLWNPLCKLYFCRHCMSLRCRFCVSHEVDSIFCPNCLEQMPVAEARLKKNRCGTCQDCPVCGHTLSVRATSAQPSLTGAVAESPDQEKSFAPKKVFYLVCGFCRWTSREAGIPDQTAASGNWPEVENKNAKALANICEKFRVMAAIEKSEKERKRFTTKRRSYQPFYTDKFGLTSLYVKKRLSTAREIAGLSGKEDSGSEQSGDVKTTELEATELVEDLPAHFLTDTLTLSQITTVAQRHNLPDLQPILVNQLLPCRKPLMSKKSQRCKLCDHNLCKSEFNPASTKFKIQLCAMFHVPEVRLFQPANLIPGENCLVLLTVTNLCPSETHLVLLPDCEFDDANSVTAVIPTAELTLPAKDETADFDDTTGSTHSFSDDPEVVFFRKIHKIGIKVNVTSPKEATDDLWLRFILKYDYVNAWVQLAGEQKMPEISWVQQRVMINLGSLSKQ